MDSVDSTASMDDSMQERSDRTRDRNAVPPDAASGRAHPHQQALESARRERAAPGLLSDARAPLLDRVAEGVQKKLQCTPADLPLARVLEAGTWLAGREIAAELRPAGGPPIRVHSDVSVI